MVFKNNKDEYIQQEILHYRGDMRPVITVI